MSEIDPQTAQFIAIKVKEAMAAEFRWGVTVGAIIGFILGLVVASQT
jgi:hypothetical protein